MATTHATRKAQATRCRKLMRAICASIDDAYNYGRYMVDNSDLGQTDINTYVGQMLAGIASGTRDELIDQLSAVNLDLVPSNSDWT